MVLLTVENAFDGDIREKDGVFCANVMLRGGE